MNAKLRKLSAIRIARRLTTLLVLATTLLSSLSLAVETLVPHTAEYKIKISVLGGRLNTAFARTPDGYMAHSTIKPTGMARLIARGTIAENSVFANYGDGLRPSEFHSVDTLSRGGEIVDFAFDWQQTEVTGVINGEDFQADLDGIVHDRISLQYALMYDLLNGGHRDSYSLQDAEKLKLLSVSSLGDKIVKVPFGTFETIGIQHRAGNSSRVTTLWCAKELDYLPVKIEQHRKGKLLFRALLEEYVPTPEANPGDESG